MFALVFAELTGIVVERPRFRDFRRNQLDYDVHRLHPVEIIREMGTDTERRLAILLRIALDFDGTCRVERIAEHHLLRARVDAAVDEAVLVEELPDLQGDVRRRFDVSSAECKREVSS